MRTVYDVNGVDITNAVTTMLLQQNELFQVELYSISSPISQTTGVEIAPTVFFLAAHDAPLRWIPINGGGATPAYAAPRFLPATIFRDAITFEVGLAASDFKVTWSSPPSITPIVQSGSDARSLPIIEHFRLGHFDNGSVKVWRAFCSKYGGGTVVFGVAAWTSGRIAEVTIAEDSVQITCKSYLDLLDVQVPRYLLEAANRVNQLGLIGTTNSVGVPPPASGTDALEIVANVLNTQNRFAFQDQSVPGKLFPVGSFDGMYCYIAGAQLSRIAHSTNNGLINFITLVNTVPAGLTVPCQLKILTSQPVDVQTAAGTSMPGFPYLPRPEDQF
jgi:hypothetical protein